ncbi:hypothetical protein AN964_16430 [Heyndrickxia shackletonii]|uniref:HTH araC/xylS-type domain-containing protein n=1 Tax=Heyndrickxia shackletonii TaxID=157838 RepID=A0A0Q3WZN1_9BACI|nr:helix-turn-helix domain-containing protein [Heyndrickxia shackletonii]KQL54930.1 hypothetical protein AN964_16430 [Heyndrickxia shackletonii]MBB2482538.1 AraC family transcriptional regulator [Bacillus sp. APMAM]NEY99398.1 AraC family transcriptional regulator [Heyndrickxia shackletonii]RTZ54033.1 AraC family transcriptional regulator [Bacillus sp. SAJ1]
MKKNEYTFRMNKVIDYINQNLDSDLSLQALARIATFSPYHFHRIFKVVVSESVHDFVNRLRMERAAKLLRHQKSQTVTEIALQCGFSSASTFSRSFKEYFGESPSQYKKTVPKVFQKNSKNCKVFSKNGKESSANFLYDIHRKADESGVAHIHRNRFIVEICTLPDFYIAYDRILHGFNKGIYSERITNAFERSFNWAEANELLTSHSKAIGILYDNFDVTTSLNFRYDAGVSINQHVDLLDGEIAIQKISGGKYAICRVERENINSQSFNVAIAELGQAADFLYGEWLPDSFYQLEDKPCIEIYHSARSDSKITIDFCLPVIPL